MVGRVAFEVDEINESIFDEVASLVEEWGWGEAVTISFVDKG